MIRARFRANPDDWRPIKFPPPGPCWCTGYAGDGSSSVVVAYLANEDQVLEFWPEATEIDCAPAESITFTSRFERPDWWPEDRTKV